MSGADSISAQTPLTLSRRGKVRDVYNLGTLLLIVASDRVSAFDVVLPTPVPGKGSCLTKISRFWFGRTAAIVPNHLVATSLDQIPAPARLVAEAHRGSWILARNAERIDVECVVRGFLAGSGWKEYARHGTLAGEKLPPGLGRAERLGEPRFTPAWKVDDGHDESISRRELRRRIGGDLAAQLEDASLRLFRCGADYCAERGLILADTKFEFGFVDGELTLIDEVLTPDSSRFWDAAGYRSGQEQIGFDKQPLRDWLERSGWDKQPPGPALPASVVADVAARYVTVSERLTEDLAGKEERVADEVHHEPR